jgi:hypothetical protein
MMLIVCMIFSCAAITLAFTEPNGHNYRAAGPFDSECLLSSCIDVK